MPTSTVGPGPTTALEERLGTLLGQLSRAWSAHRLFPGDLDRPAFTSAVERLREGARSLTVDGPVEVEVVRGRFHLAGRPVPAQEEHAALARALFTRQVEQLILRGIPEGGEVAALLGALLDDSLPVARQLEGAAVDAFVIAEMAPSATVGRSDGHVRHLDTAERSRWEQLIDVRTVRVELEAAASQGADQVATVLGHLAGVPGGHEAFQRAARELSADLREVIGAALLDPDGAFDYRAHLTDVELAVAIVGVDPREPVSVARAFVERRERGPVLVRLVETIASGCDAEGIVDELLATIGDGVPATRDDGDGDGDGPRDAALATLERSVLLQRDPDHVRPVLESWAKRTRGAVRDQDRGLVARLAGAVQRVRHDPEMRSLVDAATATTLDPALVRSILPDDPAADLGDLGELLQPLGNVAVDRLFAVLALEEDRKRRARLLTVLGDLTGGNANAVGRWIDDERWYVVRNACCVLGRVGTPSAVPLLEHAVGHHDARVRREAMRGIIAALGADALPLLRRLAVDEASTVAGEAIRAIASVGTDAAADLLAAIVRDGEVHVDRRSEALDQLAAHPSPAAAPALSRLTHEDADELSWRLRRQAQDLAHGHPEASE